MSILSSDLKVYLSGGASNSDPDAALGGLKSSVEVVDDTLNNLFDDVTGTEHTDGSTNYRCIFVTNTNGSTDAVSTKVYISTNTTSVDDKVYIGLDLTGKGTTADTIADETTAPDPAVTFVDSDSYATGIELGTLAPGESYPIWIKRVVSPGTTPQANNEFILTIACDTL